MRPIALFDKSALQSFSIDESVWLDAFYTCNITPLFFVETLADLRKPAKRRTSEDEVRLLAAKTPLMHRHPNIDHVTMCIGDLLGYHVEMRNVPVIGGGRWVTMGDGKSVMYEVSREAEALERWRRGYFDDVERGFASHWRTLLSNLNFDEAYTLFRDFIQSRGKIMDLQDAKTAATDLLTMEPAKYHVLRFALESLNASPKDRENILTRWSSLDYPPLSSFAPYTYYCILIDMFFYIALGANLISKDRPSHKIDIAYLYYLPLCQVFVSNDKLHERTVPVFLTNNQVYVKGTELKQDLAKLDSYYSSFPDEIREQGIMKFAHHPPLEGKYLTSMLWDRFGQGWREHARNPLVISPEQERELIDKIDRTVEKKSKIAKRTCL